MAKRINVPNLGTMTTEQAFRYAKLLGRRWLEGGRTIAMDSYYSRNMPWEYLGGVFWMGSGQLQVTLCRLFFMRRKW